MENMLSCTPVIAHKIKLPKGKPGNCSSSLTVFNQTKKKQENLLKLLAERGFDPRTSGLWAQHASTAPLCCR